MRKIDKKKDSFDGKAAKTINFDKIVLLKIEEKAKKIGTTPSQLVNMICRQIVLTDISFYKEMKKFHHLEVCKFDYMIEQAEAMLIVDQAKKQDIKVKS